MNSTMSASPTDHKVVNTTLNVYKSHHRNLMDPLMSSQYYLDPSKGGHTTYRIGVAEYYRYKYDTHPAQIHDIRGREDQFSLDTHGFQYHRHTSVEKDFTSDERIREVVYPETAELLKEVTGATRVHIYSHLMRKESRDEAEAAAANDPSLKDNLTRFQKVVPARFIHIDFSYDGAYEMFNDNLDPATAEQLSKTRWALINVWRPIKPISKDPLAMCDARSARDEDLKRIVSLLPSKGEGQYGEFSGGERFEMSVKAYHPGERWYYADKMGPGEVFFIKCFDTIQDGETAKRCPHSAFVDADTAHETNRESIEVRALVFFEDQPV